MSVVLRCPACGTTQGRAGECEACFEGGVRYFCTNHDKGIWLDGPVCSRCGGRFGDAPAKPTRSRAPDVPITPAGAPDFRPPARRRAPEPPPEPDFGRRPPRRFERDAPAEPEVLPRTTSLGELLEKITEGRARTGGRYEAEVPWAEPPARRGPPLAGCLLRIAGMVFLLIVAAVIFLLMLFGGFIVN
jgi:hypothetical protein